MATFKCLSVSQPFAELIVSGKKTIELRSWDTRYRGEFLVHSPLKIRSEDCKRLGINEGSLAVGAIVGKAVIYDVKIYKNQRDWHADQKYHLAGPEFSSSKYGFLLKNAKKFSAPIPHKGKLGFFDVDIRDATLRDNDIKADIFDEEYRTQWISRH
ncbi:MAG: ASCH domain-containing protein [Candidatus Nitrosotenuis sp.]